MIARAQLVALAEGLQRNRGGNEEVAGLLCEAVALAWELDAGLQRVGSRDHYLRGLLDVVTPVMELMVADILHAEVSNAKQTG